METFKYIFGGIIVATIYVLIVRYFIEQNDSYKIERKTLNRVLVIPQLHVMFIFLAIGATCALNPFQEADFVNSVLDDTFLGKVYDFFSDERPAPDPYVVAVVEYIKQNQNTFICVALLLSAVESFGLISRSINRWAIEAINIVTSICTYLYLNLVMDAAKLIVSRSMLESVANYFGQSIASALSWMEPVFTILSIALIVNHFLAHKALSKYYSPERNQKPSFGLLSAIAICGIIFLVVFYKFMLNPDLPISEEGNIQQKEQIVVNPDEGIKDDKVDEKEIASINKGGIDGEHKTDDYEIIESNIERWNYLHSSVNYQNSNSLERLYAPIVKFYGQTLEASVCVDLFTKTLNKYDLFSQRIKGSIAFTRLPDGLVRCDFVKEIQTDGTCKDYDAYLVFKKEGSNWYIAEESDKITDAYFEKLKKDNAYLEEIESDPDNRVMVVYSGGKQWVYYMNNGNDVDGEIASGSVVYRRNLKTGESDKVASLGEDFMIYLVDTFYIKDNRYLDIKGNNMSNSNMNRDIVCRIDMEAEKSRELLMGRVISRKDNQYIVSQETVIPTGKSSADGDYFFYDQYYNLDGVLIDGKTMYGEGHLGKHPFAMQIYSSKNGMTGWCQYIGNTNFMTFKGNLTSDKSFEVEIYNQSNVHCGSFLGNIDFERQQIDGIFRSLDGKDFDLFIAAE